jgi:hypothetical protein
MTGLRVALSLGIVVMAASQPLHGQAKAGGKTPKVWPPVVYVVSLAEYTDAVVLALQNCCGDSTRVVKAAGEPGCGYGLARCEFLRLDADTDTYRIQNQYYPNDRSHTTPQMMPERFPYGTQDKAVRLEQIQIAVRRMVTCHEFSHHGITPNPNHDDKWCRECKPYVPPPQLPKAVK